MGFKTKALEFCGIQLIDGDRGKNYPKHTDFSSKGDCLFLSAKNVTLNGFDFTEKSFISKEKDAVLRAGKIQKGDIVVTTRGTIGNIAFYDDSIPFYDIRINSGMMILRADPLLWNQRFLYFLLTSNFIKQQINSLVSGSAVPQLPAKDLKKFQLPEVSMIIQIQIVAHIGTIVDKIKNNNQTNQTLEQMAQTLFKSWFVDFDPVFDNLLTLANFDLSALPADMPPAMQAKAKQRLEVLTVSNAVNKEKEVQQNSTTNTNNPLPHPNFPSEFEYNEQLGWIPLGWECSITDEEFVVKGGSTPSTKNNDFWEGGEIHWTSPKDLSGNKTKIMLDTSRKITELGLAKITSGLLPVDTVLMSSRAPVGYLALAKVPVAINQGYIAITDAKTLSSEYTIQWLDSVMDEIKSISGGTTFSEISKKTFKSIELVIPSKKAVEAYTKIAKANYQRITANVREINTLTETRDCLLPKLISGELQIPESETNSK